ncbi:MAG: HAMP domain-containing protein [Actinobacteria bacterium]|nr:HAMP domain-containing protein [Actinomycetota bacterium]
MGKGENGKSSEYRRRSSAILIQITALVVIVALISGGASLLIFRRSQNRMIENSKDKLVETEAGVIASSHQFVPDISSMMWRNLAVPEYSPEELASAAAAGEITPSQEAANDLLKSMVDTNFFEIDAVVEAVPPSDENPNAVIVLSSNDDYMYEDLPEELKTLVEKDGDTYRLLEDGVPELGLKGEHLVTTHVSEAGNSGSALWYFDFKPMGRELAAIDAFYNKESGYINKVLGVVVGGSVLALVIITFFILSWLIRNRINKPIDELCAAAEQVMDGDLDVKVPVRKGEEFAGLKTVFNNMLRNLNALFVRLAGQDGPDIDVLERKPVTDGKKHRGRSRIPIYVTCLIAIVFIVSGVLSFMAFSRSQNRLIEKSKEYIVRRHATLVASAHDFFEPLLDKTYMAGDTLIRTDASPEELQKYLTQVLEALDKKEMNDLIYNTSAVLRDVVRTGLYGAQVAITFVPPRPPLMTEPANFMSSNDEFFFMEIPESFRELAENEDIKNEGYRGRIDDKNIYMLFEDGIPELKMEGETLTILLFQELALPGGSTAITQWYYINVPMGEELAAIDEFYSKESNAALLQAGVVLAVSLIVLVLISYFVLNLLIRKNITAPIDELADAAEKVMEGNFNVEVPVRKGEQFEGLKRAFNEMLKTIRDIANKNEDA